MSDKVGHAVLHNVSEMGEGVGAWFRGLQIDICELIYGYGK